MLRCSFVDVPYATLAVIAWCCSNYKQAVEIEINRVIQQNTDPKSVYGNEPNLYFKKFLEEKKYLNLKIKL